jgi:hypothetical protein
LPKEQEIMSDTTSPGAAGVPSTGADAHSEHFNNMVMQIANTALTFLGAVPHPETGEHIHDLDMARLLIDQLAMLEVKTKGNLNAQEAALLKQALMAARMAFVETAKAAKPTAAQATGATEPTKTPEISSDSKPSTAEDERKKFTKKY